MAEADATALCFAGFTLDTAARTLVDANGREVPLRRSEYELLRAFLAASGRALSRDHLLDAVASRHAEPFDRSVDVLVGRLRRKLEPEPGKPRLIVTVPGVGYRFAARPRPVFAEGDAAPAAVPAPSAAPPASPERRQVTVVHCGLCGPALLAARHDPEELQQLLTVFHEHAKPVVTEAGGTVERLLSDGLVACFGYPQADEHQAERAIRAALQLVAAAGRVDTGQSGRLQLRFGVATGLAVVSDQSSGQPTALGEAASIAAGLASHAEPGSVLISASTRRLLGELFELRSSEPTALEDAGQTVEVWQVTGEGVAGSRFEALRGAKLAPLVGREEELELLLRRWAHAKAGSGKVVLIGGEPGIGKSRLARAFQDAIAGEPHVELRFFCSPHHQDSALYPHVAQLGRAAGFARDDTNEAKLAKLDAVLAQSDATDEAVALIAELLSIGTDQRERIQQMTPQARRERTLAALLAQLAGLAARQPVLMIYEDVHWIDPSSRELLDRTIERLDRLPVLLLATFRPEFQAVWAGQPNVASLVLTRLNRPDTAALIAGIVGENGLPPDIVEEIAERTDGVPLFVEELTKAVQESSVLKDGGDRYEYVGSARSVTIPATLRDSLMARLGRFLPVREIAQIGAAIGRAFSYEMIAAVAPMPPAQLDDALARLCESGLAFRRGTPPEAVYSFKHALVQDAAYDSLLKRRRQELHTKIARVIEQRFPSIKVTEPEVLAHHLTAAGRAEAAIPLWQTAGELAFRRMALTEAIAHLNRGLELIATLSRSSERDASELGLRRLLGTAWLAFKGWAAPEVWTSLHPALALAKSLGRHDALAPILWGLTNNVLTQGRIAESLPWMEEMLTLAEVTEDADLLVAGHALACTCYCFAGDFIKALQHAGTVEDLYEAERHRHLADVINHDPRTQAGIFASICTWALGYPDQALLINNEKDAHARRRGHPLDLGYALTTGAHEFDRRCGHENLHERAEECERLGRENGLPPLWAIMAPRGHGLACIREGQVDEGITWLKAGIAAWEATGGKARSPTMKAFLAEAMALTGNLDHALDLINETIAQVECPGWEERLSYAEILRLKGWVLSLKGDPDGAEQSFLASLTWARRQQAKSWELRTAMSLARLWQSQGKRQDAYELLAPVYNWFTEGFDTRDLQEAKLLLAELA